jgi:hypothetical protein
MKPMFHVTQLWEGGDSGGLRIETNGSLLQTQ